MLLCWFLLAQTSDLVETRRIALLPQDAEIGHIVIGRAGRTFAYVASKDNRSRAVIGDWISEPYPIAVGFVFSHDLKSCIWLSVDENGWNSIANKGTVLWRYKARSGWGGTWPVAVSGDGSTVAQKWHDETRKRWTIAVNGEPGREHAEPVGVPVISRDGWTVAYQATLNGNFLVVHGDLEGPAYDIVGNPVVTPDGRTVVYSADKEDQTFVHANDKRWPVRFPVRTVFASEDGAKVGYIAHRKSGEKRTWSITRLPDAEELPEYLGIDGACLSPDGALAFIARGLDGEDVVVVGEKRYPAEGVIRGPEFYDGGKKIGYGARLGNELWWKVIPR